MGERAVAGTNRSERTRPGGSLGATLVLLARRFHRQLHLGLPSPVPRPRCRAAEGSHAADAQESRPPQSRRPSHRPRRVIRSAVFKNLVLSGSAPLSFHPITLRFRSYQIGWPASTPTNFTR